jgi:hypothetical protein
MGVGLHKPNFGKNFISFSPPPSVFSRYFNAAVDCVTSDDFRCRCNGSSYELCVSVTSNNKELKRSYVEDILRVKTFTPASLLVFREVIKCD